MKRWAKLIIMTDPEKGGPVHVQQVDIEVPGGAVTFSYRFGNADGNRMADTVVVPLDGKDAG